MNHDGEVVLEKLLTVEDVARLLSVPVKTLYDWRGTGYGPAALKVGRYLRYRPADVRRWVDDQLP
ncbi:helix-turn-helix transcriptional regulator [Sciscionella sediminilitoris]|uniref:helix-turn-helix transcriptional regulator n=1 Tax=Sciscionella sediminilitoris TaxID=1445613 RepID=UPI0009E8EC8A|nr:helix-turn-helix domain-containing protein [Sciscionella sp. SE31]